MDKVVLTKDEFVKIVAERSTIPSDISRIMKYVESIFMLQSDEDRPVYIFEVDFDKMDSDNFATLNDCLRYLKVAAVLVPKKSVKYLGEVTPQSMGIKGKINELRNSIRRMFAIINEYGDDEDGR